MVTEIQLFILFKGGLGNSRSDGLTAVVPVQAQIAYATSALCHCQVPTTSSQVLATMKTGKLTLNRSSCKFPKKPQAHAPFWGEILFGAMNVFLFSFSFNTTVVAKSAMKVFICFRKTQKIDESINNSREIVSQAAEVASQTTLR